jgi:NitT/TauT family transport system substrate-binding protein
MTFVRSLAVALAAIGLVASAHAQPKQEKIDFVLNWVPGGDHVPYYYAKKMGWYRDAGIDLNIEPGKGSAVAVQKVGAGANQIGLADMASSTSMPTRRKASTG